MDRQEKCYFLYVKNLYNFQSSGEIESAHEFEFGGDKYNDSWSDSGKFTDK